MKLCGVPGSWGPLRRSKGLCRGPGRSTAFRWTYVFAFVRVLQNFGGARLVYEASCGVSNKVCEFLGKSLELQGQHSRLFGFFVGWDKIHCRVQEGHLEFSRGLQSSEGALRHPFGFWEHCEGSKRTLSGLLGNIQGAKGTQARFLEQVYIVPMTL